jgi:hypothetical protein
MCHTHTLFEIYEIQKTKEKIEKNETRTCKHCSFFKPEEFKVFGKCEILKKLVAKEHICPL